ncbi:MAG: hypothetical protein ACI9CO_001810 [Candidatus Azotimanducaceae bacterium]|jgi:hypothetical protein
MFHMLSWFDLKPQQDIQAFKPAYSHFVKQMQALDLVESSGPIGQRQSDTPMDTDDDRKQQYFVIMTFRDRPQVDKAYAYIMEYIEPGKLAHGAVYSKVVNPYFICWQDID